MSTRKKIKKETMMDKKTKLALMVVILIAAVFFGYRLFAIRVVNYEIAGIKIPSRYNILTGTIRPIVNYNKKTDLPTVERLDTGKLGLSQEQVVIAKLQWAIFEEWANMKAEYKGWQDDPETFKKTREAFKKALE